MPNQVSPSQAPHPSVRATPRKRIVVNIKGGLGNQLFQAAFGLVMAQVFDADLRLLDEHFKIDTYGRAFLLDEFPTLRGLVAGSPRLAASQVVQELTSAGPAEMVMRISAALEAADEVLLDGYWQNPAYYRGFDSMVRAATDFHAPLEVAAEIDTIQRLGAIGVHVRRSEYGHLGLVRAQYYIDSIQRIRSMRNQNCPAIVFTDEPNFSRHVFSAVPNCVVISGNTSAPLADFARLTACRDFVIANSSFSWWAAWRGSSPDSIVVAPDPWCIIDRAVAPALGNWIVIPDSVYGP